MEHEEQQADGAAPIVQFRSDDLPATSLLSLPDDLLLPIFEEIHDDKRHKGDGATSVREVLINRRIFRLARPIWISHLSLQSDLHRKLSLLRKDDIRLRHVRSVALKFDDAQIQLIKSTLSCLPRLSQLTINGSSARTPAEQELRVNAVLGISQPIELVFNADDDDRLNFVKTCVNRDPRKFRSAAETRDGAPIVNMKLAEGVPEAHWFSAIDQHRRFAWTQLSTLDINPVGFSDQFAGNLLGSLSRALESSPGGIPIKAFGLKLRYNVLADGNFDTYDSEGLTRLLDLLSQTQIERLTFHAVNWLPRITAEHQLLSLTSLKIEAYHTTYEREAFNFNEPTAFRNFSRLLRCCPNLKQLCLSATLFGPDTDVDNLPNLNATDLCFEYPVLSALLFYLKTSTVKILALRGENGDREVRWTRSTADEEFDRECWTL
ncbi:uncharacterized protein JCM6883_004465 [Sporobolomyces salmoneus]|uniref:uncharacterized protein n=1 Tax=Sporobolomyces salmoneus TaxID=183962 RepID=UPI0031705C0D